MVIDTDNKIVIKEQSETILEAVFVNIKKYMIRVDIGADPIGTNSGYNAGFLKSPYFKVIKESKYSARISLLDGSLISPHKDGYINFTPSSSDKKYLINNLPKEIKSGVYKGKSVFDAMWDFIIEYAKNNNYEYAEKSNINDVLGGIKDI